MSHRLIHIARAEEMLGKFPEAEVRALLEAEFLRVTDDFWFAGMADWRPLSELNAEVKPEPTLAQRAKETMVAAGGLLSAGAQALAEKAEAFAERSSTGASESKRKVLEDYIPQIKRVLSEKVGAPVISSARAAMENDVVMTKTFGLAYDFLPRPICRFVSEKEFVTFCLEHRKKLLS